MTFSFWLLFFSLRKLADDVRGLVTSGFVLLSTVRYALIVFFHDATAVPDSPFGCWRHSLLCHVVLTDALVVPDLRSASDP